MSKLFILIFYSAAILSLCEKQELSNINAASTPTPTPPIIEKQSQTASNTAYDWRNSPRFNCFSAPGKNKIWVTTAEDRKLLLTEDGGSNWKTVHENNISCVNFADENRGWLIDAENRITATGDGGKSWSEKLLDITVSAGGKIKFTDSSNGWILDSTSLYRSGDGGSSWTQILSYKDKHLLGQPDNFFFLDTQTGWVCDAGDISGNLYATADAGKTWSVKKIGKNLSAPCNVFFINAKEGWYSLQSNQTFQTKDGGKSWKSISSLPADFEVHSMFWHDSNNGWLAGFFVKKPRESHSGKGALLRTNDGGKTWTQSATDENAPFYSKIHFTDSKNGWLLSRDNIYKTSDGGEKWNLSYSLPPLK